MPLCCTKAGSQHALSAILQVMNWLNSSDMSHCCAENAVYMHLFLVSVIIVCTYMSLADSRLHFEVKEGI